MKTLELKLKKDVLIVDLTQKVQNFKEVTITNNVLFADGKGNRTCLFIKFRDKLDDESINEYLEKGLKRIVLDYIDGEFEYKCKGSELTEEIASELVENKTKHKFENKVLTFYNCKNLESFISAVESKGFHWLENPIEKPIEENFNLGDIHTGFYHKKHKKWQVAEDKTFKNHLIFVKK